MEMLRDAGKNVVALAPTGVAANNIGGQTIHSMFGLTPFGVLDWEGCKFMKDQKRRMIRKIDVIVIDEVSMLRPDVLDAINWTMAKNACGHLWEKQVVFVGDLAQLPPPIDDNMRSVLMREYSGEKFMDAKCWGKLKVRTVELEEVLRQSDMEFIEALNLVRDGIKAPYFKKFIGLGQKGVVLAPHNATVKEYNQRGLDALEGKEIMFKARVDGNLKADDFNLEDEVRVKDGAKIMYLVNSKNNPLVNGTIGEFKVFPAEVDDDGNGYGEKYFIRVGEENYAIEPVEMTKKEYVLDGASQMLELKELGSITQVPIRLAYALSIHKSQGCTFEACTIDLRRPVFQRGQLYTALSRVTGPEGLSIIM